MTTLEDGTERPTPPRVSTVISMMGLFFVSETVGEVSGKNREGDRRRRIMYQEVMTRIETIVGQLQLLRGHL
jgi:hypothetical protein